MSLGVFSEIANLDHQVFVWLNQFMSRGLLSDLFVWLHDALIVRFFPLVLAVCWLWFEKSPKQEFNRQILLEGVLTGFAALVVGRSLALVLPFRDRPLADLDLHFAVPVDVQLRTWSSFPSDHAVLAFALAASLFRVSPKIGLWAFFHATMVICLPRLYFGLHYPSDLIGGALIGIMLAYTASRLPVRHAVTGLLLKVESARPAMFYAFGFLVLVEIAEMFQSMRSVAVEAFKVLRHVVS